MCQKCQNQNDETAEIKVLIVDCRLTALQKESSCPYGIGLQISNNINRSILSQ